MLTFMSHCGSLLAYAYACVASEDQALHVSQGLFWAFQSVKNHTTVHLTFSSSVSDCRLSDGVFSSVESFSTACKQEIWLVTYMLHTPTFYIFERLEARQERKMTALFTLKQNNRPPSLI